MANFGMKMVGLLMETCAAPVLKAFQTELSSPPKILKCHRWIYNLQLEQNIERKMKEEVIADLQQTTSQSPTAPAYTTILSKHNKLVETEKQLWKELGEVKLQRLQ